MKDNWVFSSGVEETRVSVHALFKMAFLGKMFSDLYLLQNRDKGFHTTKTPPISVITHLERSMHLTSKLFILHTYMLENKQKLFL